MPKKTEKMAEWVIQLIACIALIVIFILDKIMQKIKPPLSDYWYAALFGVAAFGRGIKEIFEVFKK